MTEEEIEKEAKEYAQGNFYSEQGFLYGYERGFTEGRNEKCNSCGLRQQKRINLAKENEQLKAEIENLKKTYRKQRNKRIDELQKENEQLKKEISVLLSCKNCPENKGGYICEKEYNDKCLAQKIEYIKELEEQIEKMKCCENCKFEENGMDYELGEPCYRCEAFSNWKVAE